MPEMSSVWNAACKPTLRRQRLPVLDRDELVVAGGREPLQLLDRLVVDAAPLQRAGEPRDAPDDLVEVFGLVAVFEIFRARHQRLRVGDRDERLGQREESSSP